MVNSVTFPLGLGGDGSTVDDSESPTTGLDAGGHAYRFVPALSQMVAVCNYTVTTTNANNAAAAASAATAVNAPGTNATSTTSLTVGTGSKTLTIQTGKNIVVGMSVKIAFTTTPTTWMHGDVTAYNSGTGSLTVNVTNISGSGTQAAWTISLSAPAVTAAGALTAANNLSDLSNLTTAQTNLQVYAKTATYAQVEINNHYNLARAVRRGRQAIYYIK